MLEIVKRPDSAKGFEVLPRRWVVERTFAWLGRCRRLAQDFERTIASAEAWIHGSSSLTSASSQDVSQGHEIANVFLIQALRSICPSTVRVVAWS